MFEDTNLELVGSYDTHSEDFDFLMSYLVHMEEYLREEGIKSLCVILLREGGKCSVVKCEDDVLD